MVLQGSTPRAVPRRPTASPAPAAAATAQPSAEQSLQAAVAAFIPATVTPAVERLLKVPSTTVLSALPQSVYSNSFIPPDTTVYCLATGLKATLRPVRGLILNLGFVQVCLQHHPHCTRLLLCHWSRDAFNLSLMPESVFSISLIAPDSAFFCSVTGLKVPSISP